MLNWLDLSGSSNRYRQMYLKGFLDISGGNLILRNNHLHILTGDASFGNNIYVKNTANINKLSTNDITINGNFNYNFPENSISPNAIIGGIPISTGIFEVDMSFNKRVFIGGNTIMNKDISLNGNVNLSGTIYKNGVPFEQNFVSVNSPTFTGTVSGITKSMVGLSNVDNTSDLNKPISTATQSALNAITGSPPTSLNSLQKLALAMNNDPSYVGNVVLQVINKASLLNPVFAGNVIIPKLIVTGDASLNNRLYLNNDGAILGKLTVNGDVSMNGNVKGKQLFENGVSLINKYATLASPTFTGNVNIPGATITTLNSTSFTSNSSIVNTDSSFNARLFIGGDVSMNGNLVLGKQMKVNGKSIFYTDVSLNNNIDISGAVIAHNNINLFGVINQQSMNVYDGVLTTFDGTLINQVNMMNSIVNTNSNTNTVIGKNAALPTGTNNTVIGYNASPSSVSVTNEITLGNSSINTLRCAASTITSLSDKRDKKNIESLDIGIDFINTIQPVKFTWNTRDGGKQNQNDIGFIAQELLNAQELLGINVPGLVNTDNPDKLEASYAKLIPILVKSIQEMQREIDILKHELCIRNM